MNNSTGRINRETLFISTHDMKFVAMGGLQCYVCGPVARILLLNQPNWSFNFSFCRVQHNLYIFTNQEGSNTNEGCK